MYVDRSLSPILSFFSTTTTTVTNTLHYVPLSIMHFFCHETPALFSTPTFLSPRFAFEPTAGN
jgi:hypothetical protein